MSHKTAILNLAVAVIVLTSWTAAAQGPGGQGHRPPTPAVDTVLDTDGDQIISADEIYNAETRLATLDADDDNQLSFEECMGFSSSGNDRQPPRGEENRAGGQPPSPPIFAALDANDDRLVDSGEIADASDALRKLDKNLDGQLSTDEYRPQHPGGQKGGGPKGGGQNMR